MVHEQCPNATARSSPKVCFTGRGLPFALAEAYRTSSGTMYSAESFVTSLVAVSWCSQAPLRTQRRTQRAILRTAHERPRTAVLLHRRFARRYPRAGAGIAVSQMARYCRGSPNRLLACDMGRSASSQKLGYGPGALHRQQECDAGSSASSQMARYRRGCPSQVLGYDAESNESSSTIGKR